MLNLALVLNITKLLVAVVGGFMLMTLADNTILANN